MFPVQQDGCVSHNAGHVDVGIFDADTSMWSSSEDQKVFRVGVRFALRIQPAFREKEMWVWVNLWIMKRWIERRDDHAVHRDRIRRRDREWLCGFVWDLNQSSVGLYRQIFIDIPLSPVA